MVRRLADKKAKELGYAEITVDILEQFKNQMMGQMGGEAGMSQAAEDMVAGKLPWTAEARKRLASIPEFMRSMIANIAEVRMDRRSLSAVATKNRTFPANG
jgi:hypothetical protein